MGCSRRASRRVWKRPGHSCRWSCSRSSQLVQQALGLGLFHRRADVGDAVGGERPAQFLYGGALPWPASAPARADSSARLSARRPTRTGHRTLPHDSGLPYRRQVARDHQARPLPLPARTTYSLRPLTRGTRRRVARLAHAAGEAGSVGQPRRRQLVLGRRGSSRCGRRSGAANSGQTDTDLPIVGSRHPRERGAQHVAAFTHCSAPVLCESPQSACRRLWVNSHRAVRIGWPMRATLRVKRVHGPGCHRRIRSYRRRARSAHRTQCSTPQRGC